MLNLTGMVRVPEYRWEVLMDRKRCGNAVQDARQKVAYVRAPNADDAMRAARKYNPEFFPVSARRAA